MTSIKKDFVALIAFLEANQDKKVSKILDELKDMCSAKTAQSCVKYDADGKVVSVFCYYHKCWEDVATVEYGSKSNTATGLNTMCKQGVNHWTKQLRNYKAQVSRIAEQLIAGEITPDEAKEAQAQALAARDAIVPRTE